MIQIRQAKKEDAALVADVVMVAADICTWEEREAEKHARTRMLFREVCEREDTLYSYTHVSVLEADGEIAGCLVSYPGALYPTQRARTWALMQVPDNIQTDEETEAGEYYLDSMTILPEYRGRGYGLELMKDGIERAKKTEGVKKVSLIAMKSRPGLRAYYAKLGFREEKEILFFGCEYVKMVLALG